jgi:hypothetical protein
MLILQVLYPLVAMPPPQAPGITNLEQWVGTHKHQKNINKHNVDERFPIAEFLCFAQEFFSSKMILPVPCFLDRQVCTQDGHVVDMLRH